MGAIAGFLPVLYSLLQAHFTPPVQLPPDSVDEPVNAQSAGLKLKSEPLRGYKVLLLWLPAACDLTGTTVRQTVSFIVIPVVFADICSSRLSSTVYPVDECRPSLYTSVDISDDPRRPRSLRRYSQCHLPAPPSLALPVRGRFVSHLKKSLYSIKLRIFFLLICKPWRSSIDGSRY